MKVLDRIVETKRREVAQAKSRLPMDTLVALTSPSDAPHRFSKALSGGEGPHIIAEVKRASPSAGLIRGHGLADDWDPAELAQAYARGGARCLSVLTDIQFFWGHPDALHQCSEASGLPALRKDFVLEPYQIYESRWLGADAVLLIARILDRETLVRCAQIAQELAMDVLVEIHHERELDAALACEGAMIGVNHRDLDTLQIDLDLSIRLRDRIPEERIAIAESGVSDRTQIERLMEHGYSRFLIGEYLARQPVPESALRVLRGTR
ncbi:MAG: indole-3-glycerol phosphate synthase TrpC [Myxococcota bacterium]